MKNREYCKHLVECKCILPQFRKMPDPPLHKFIVFSELDSKGLVVPSLTQCPNCGLVHKIKEVGVSEKLRKEDAASVLTVDEIKSSLPDKITDGLSGYDLEAHQWQEIRWILENEDWGRTVIISKEIADGLVSGKYIQIVGKELWKVGSFTKEDNQNIVEPT